tara:strand:- start:7735 stop:15054 length:7320 start_codon:yes stop_codon:yes gene_type:complete
MSICRNTNLFEQTSAQVEAIIPSNAEGKNLVSLSEFKTFLYGTSFSEQVKRKDILLNPNIAFSQKYVDTFGMALSRSIRFSLPTIVEHLKETSKTILIGKNLIKIEEASTADIISYAASQFKLYAEQAQDGKTYDVKSKGLKNTFDFLYNFYANVEDYANILNSTIVGNATADVKFDSKAAEDSTGKKAPYLVKSLSTSQKAYLNESMTSDLFQMLGEDADPELLAKVILKEEGYRSTLKEMYGSPSAGRNTVYKNMQEYLKKRLNLIARAHQKEKSAARQIQLSKEHANLSELIDTVNKETNTVESLGLIGQSWDSIIKNHLVHMSRYDFNLDTASIEDIATDEAQDENEVNTRDSLGITPAHEVNPVSRLSREVKAILQTLPQVQKWSSKQGKYIFTQNKLGGTKLADFSKIQGIMYKTLSNKEGLDAKIAALEKLASENYTFQILLDRLGFAAGMDLANLTPFQMNLFISLANSFNNAGHKYHIVQVTDQGARNVMNANKESEHNAVKRVWKENFTYAVQSSLGKVNSKKQRVLNLNAPYKNGTLASAIKANKGVGDTLDLLAVLGIQFTNKKAVEDLLNYSGYIDYMSGMSTGTDSAFVENANMILNQIADKEGDIINVFDLDLGGRFNQLVGLELETSDQLGTLSFQGIDGSKIYGVSLKGFNDVMADLIFENSHIKEAMLKSPTTHNSKYLKSRNRIEIATLLGTVNTGDQFSSSVDKAGLADTAAQEVSSILSGHVPFIKAGNKKTHTTMKFEDPNFNRTKAEFAKQLIGYLEDEIVTAHAIKHGAASQIKGLREKGSTLQLFAESKKSKGRFKDIQNISNKLIDNPDTTRGQVAEALKNPIIISAINLYMLNERTELIKDLVEYNVIQKDGKGFTNISLDSNQLQAINNGQEVKYLTPALVNKIADHIFMIRTESLHEQFKIFLGHPALYKDLFKRTSGLIGPKKYPVTHVEVLDYVNKNFPSVVNPNRHKEGRDIGTVRYITRAEVLETSAYINEYVQTLSALKAEPALKKLIRDTYSDMEIFDGGGFITLDFYRLVRRLTDSWTQSHEDAYNNVITDTATPSDIAKLDPLKPQVLAQALEDNIDIRIFNKFALFPIHPNLSKVVGQEVPLMMEQIHQDMIDNNLDYMVMESATKVGAKTRKDGEFDQYVNEDNDYMPIETDEAVQEYDLKFFGIQMDPKGKRSSNVAAGTQSLSMMLTNVFDNAQVQEKYKKIDFSKTETWEEASNRFHRLNGAIIQRETQILANKLGYAYNKITNEFSSLGKAVSKELMRDTILEELERRDVSRLMRETIIDLFEGDVNLLNQIPEKARLETIVNSIVTNAVIRRKMNGDMVVLQSNFGYEVTNEAKKQKDAPKEIQEMGKLKFYRKENGPMSSTLAMQVYLPHSFKEFLGEEVPTELIDLNDPRIREHVGFRIPTEGYNSMEFIEVVGYLPQSAGSTIIVPSEMVAKSGADYDIDKLTLYIPNTRFVDGKLVVEPSITKASDLRIRDLGGYKNVILTLFDPNKAISLIQELDGLYRNKKITNDFLKTFAKHPVIKARKEKIEQLKEDIEASESTLDKREISKQIENIYKDINTQLLNTPEGLFAGQDFNRDGLIGFRFALNEALANIDEQVEMQGFQELPQQEKETKAYLQNELQFFMKDVLRHPLSFDQLITPVGAHGLKSLAYRIDALVNPDKYVDPNAEVLEEKPKNLLDELSFKNIIELTRTMYQTLGGTGIVATSMTHAIKVQKTGLEFNKDHTFNFANMSKIGAPSLSKVYSHNSKRAINSEMQQYVTGYVDGEKDPFVMYVNAGKDAAAVHMVLLRAGLPLEEVLYFMSQPIISDFLRMKSLNQSVALRASRGRNTYLSDEDIIKDLSNGKKYGNTEMQSPTGGPHQFTLAQLKSMVGKKLKSEEEGMQLETNDKKRQKAILTDFLRYKEYADELRKLQEIHSYDKVKLKNGSENVYMEAMERVVQVEDKFTNPMLLVTTPTSMLKYNRDALFASNELLGQVDLKNSNSMLREFFVQKAISLIDAGIRKDDVIYTLNKFDNFVTASLIQGVVVNGNETIADKRYSLMQGENSLPRRIKALQDSRELTNLALDAFLPILDSYVQGAVEFTSDNLKLRKSVMDTLDVDIVADEMRELKRSQPAIYRDLIYFSMLQSGVDFNPNAFYSIIPAEDVLPITKSAFTAFAGRNNNNNELNNMWKNFYDANWDNRVITKINYAGSSGTNYSSIGKNSIEAKTFPNIKQNSLTLTSPAGSAHYMRADRESEWQLSAKKGIRGKAIEATDSASMYLTNRIAKVEGEYKAGPAQAQKITAGYKILSADRNVRPSGIYMLSDGTTLKITKFNNGLGTLTQMLKNPEVLKTAGETKLSKEQLASMLGYESLAGMKNSPQYKGFVSGKNALYLSKIEVISVGTETFKEAEPREDENDGNVNDTLFQIKKESNC